MNRRMLKARPRRAGTPCSPQIASVSSSYLAVEFGSGQQSLIQNHICLYYNIPTPLSGSARNSNIPFSHTGKRKNDKRQRLKIGESVMIIFLVPLTMRVQIILFLSFLAAFY